MHGASTLLGMAKAKTTKSDEETRNWRDIVYADGPYPTADGRGPRGGPDALKLVPDGMMVEMINLSLKPYTLDLPSDRIKEDTTLYIPESTVVGLLEKIRVPSLIALKHLDRPQAIEQYRANQTRHWVLAPPDGDCRGNLTFRDMERGWPMCYFANCPRHPMPKSKTLPEEDNVRTPDVTWSIFHALHFLRSLHTDAAILRFVEIFDTREAVYTFGHRLRLERQRLKRERAGRTGADALRKTATY